MTQPKFTYVLPALVESGPMDDPKAAGAWLKIDRLNALTEALKVGAKTVQRDDIKSIPDPWAQPLLFERALLDINHPLHEVVRVQWRSLLATMALQGEFSGAYSVSISNLAIDRSSLFRRVLKELEPVRVLHPEMSWSQQSLLIFREQAGEDAFAYREGQTLGFISPTTLVAAVQGSDRVRCAAVPWLVNGLSDPAKAALGPRHFRILADYINRIAAGLVASGELDPRFRTRLLEELTSFHTECVAKAIPVQNLKDYPLALNWPTRIHQELLGHTKSYEAEQRPPADSDAVLRMTPALARVVNGAVLIDESLANTLKKEPQAISVWGRYSLAEALQPATLATIRREAEEAGWLVVTPDDIFSQALVNFDSSTRIDAHQGDFVSALMPLTPLALMLMPAADLVRATQLQKGSAEATVLLTLRLQGGGSHAVQKTLPIVSSEVPNDLSFWPNFRSPGWRWTYFHFSGNPTYQVRPRFAVTSDFIAEETTFNCLNDGDKVRRLRRWFEPRVGSVDAQFGFAPGAPRFSEIRVGDRRLLQRVGFYATEQSVGEMHHLPEGADAIFFARQLDDGDYVTVGMSVVKFEDPTAANVGPTDVAIDFGTTNTVVYRKRSNVIERVDFSERVLFPFGIREKEENRRRDLIELYTTFFPLKAHESPFPTVAKLREFRPALPPELQREVDGGKVESHGLTDAIFFVPNFEGFLQWHAKLNPGENLYLDWTERGILKFRLKWGESASMRAMAARFLRQTMMMTAAETVASGGSAANIAWRFSFPQAFKPRERGQLEGEIRAGWTELFGDIAEPPEEPFLRKAEGLAAGHYFLRLSQRMPDRLMMILDIGGGTTDIALWKDEKPIWRNSLKVAGGDFFTAYLANNIELLRDIDLSDVADGLSQASRLDEDGRRDFVELFVNKPNFNTKFAAGFRRLSAEPVGEGLRQVSLVALGGLMYYVGLVLRRLIDDPESPIEESDLNRLTVGFAGRGSTLFRQLQGGGQDDELVQVLKIAVAAAGGQEDSAQLSTRFSDAKEAKHEVAKGLLVDVTSDPTVRERRFAVLGEDMQIHGREGLTTVSASDDLAALAAAPRFDDLELLHLQKVLIAIRKLTGVGIDMQALGGLDEIRNRVRSQLRTSLDQLEGDAFQDRDSQPFEPPFVIALRELVRLMAQNLEVRDRFLVVKEA